MQISSITNGHIHVYAAHVPSQEFLMKTFSKFVANSSMLKSVELKHLKC